MRGVLYPHRIRVLAGDEVKDMKKMRGKIEEFVVRRLAAAFFRWREWNHGWPGWKWLQVALVVGGLSLIGFYAAVRLETYLESRAALNEFQSRSAPEIVRQRPPIESHDPESEVAALLKAKKQTPRRAPLGALEISRIHLQVPLFDGADDQTLNRGVGRIAGTAHPGEDGNIGIAGHRDTFFKGLKDVKPGDAVVLKTGTGIDTYVVSQFQVVPQEDVSVLRARDAPALTLVTCYPFSHLGHAPLRFVVTAYLENREAAGNTATDARLINQPDSTTQEEQ